MVLKNEKQQLMETRREMKKEVLLQKKTINEAFEKMKMKSKGKMDTQPFEKLGYLNTIATSKASRVASNSPMAVRSNYRNAPL